MPDEPDDGITFTAFINKITTTIDGGWRMTLDLDANAGPIISELSQCRDDLLQVAMIPVRNSPQQ